MRAEEQTKPYERYLFAGEYFSDKAITIWQAECIERCKEKLKNDAYNKFINWVRQDNEIAIFTLYAYADFQLPKKFDTIFQLDNLNNCVKSNFELTQGILEGWFPYDNISHNNKHLCIFRFEENISPILKLLHKNEGKFSTSPKGQIKLGFCNSTDFEDIRLHFSKISKLKQRYGEKWYEFEE